MRQKVKQIRRFESGLGRDRTYDQSVICVAVHQLSSFKLVNHAQCSFTAVLPSVAMIRRQLVGDKSWGGGVSRTWGMGKFTADRGVNVLYQGSG